MPDRSSRQSGVVLLHTDEKLASAWVRQGLVPSYVVPLAGWTAVVPGGQAQAAAPYDDPLILLAGRPISVRLRASLAFFEIDKRAVVVVRPRRWRALPRWLVWEPGSGVVHVCDLPAARPTDLTLAAGVVPEIVRVVRDILANRSATPLDVLSDLMGALALPGEVLLRSDLVKQAEDAALVEPDHKAIRRFSRITNEDREIRAEMDQL